MSDLEKFKVEERIKLSMFKHRGNVIEMARELGLDMTYIRKVVAKLQKREERDVKVRINHTLMTHLMEGYQSRLFHLHEMLRFLEGKHSEVVSLCCRAPVIKDDTGIVLCTVCKSMAQVHTLDKVAIYQLKKDLIEQLRLEDAELVNFAVKMGYTNPNTEETGGMQYVDKRQMIVMGGASDSPELRELKQLTPLERDALRLKLENDLLTKSAKEDHGTGNELGGGKEEASSIRQEEGESKKV